MRLQDILMTRFFIFIIFTLLISGCGRLSQNNVVSDKIIMKDAKVNGEIKSGVLTFHKYSWFAQATMHYDLLIAEITPDDPFFQWFSPIVQRDLQSCGRAFISSKYQAINGILTHALFREQLENQGVTELVPTQFMIPFKLHHFYQRYALGRYKLVALCQRGSDPITLKVQGYSPVTIP